MSLGFSAITKIKSKTEQRYGGLDSTLSDCVWRFSFVSSNSLPIGQYVNMNRIGLNVQSLMLMLNVHNYISEVFLLFPFQFL